MGNKLHISRAIQRVGFISSLEDPLGELVANTGDS